MHPAVTKLLSIASLPIAAHDVACGHLDRWGQLGRELGEMLQAKNGFYAYESALLVRLVRSADAPLGLTEWNAPSLWKSGYAGSIGNALCFAEDIFGGQVCIRDDVVCAFDPETGAFDQLSRSIGEWADDLMARCNFRTGYPLAHGWQVANRPLVAGERVLPRTPFVLGGKYVVENLYPLQDVEGMRLRASIAGQIRELPDGSQVILQVKRDGKGRGQKRAAPEPGDGRRKERGPGEE